jgi:hypothetical protein
MEQHFSEANGRSNSKDVSRLLQKPKFITVFSRAHHCILSYAK